MSAIKTVGDLKEALSSIRDAVPIQFEIDGESFRLLKSNQIMQYMDGKNEILLISFGDL